MQADCGHIHAFGYEIHTNQHINGENETNYVWFGGSDDGDDDGFLYKPDLNTDG